MEARLAGFQEITRLIYAKNIKTETEYPAIV